MSDIAIKVENLSKMYQMKDVSFEVFDKSMPEEINRILTDAVSDYQRRWYIETDSCR